MQLLKCFWLNKTVLCCKKLLGCGHQCPCSPGGVVPQFWSLLCLAVLVTREELPWLGVVWGGTGFFTLLQLSASDFSHRVQHPSTKKGQEKSEVVCLHFQSVLQNFVLKICILWIKRCDDKDVYWLDFEKMPFCIPCLPPSLLDKWSKTLLGEILKNSWK